MSQTLILGSSGGPNQAADKRSALKQLEMELNALVDRMEGEWREYGMLSSQSAEQLHELLQRTIAL